jgi:MFS family permease
MFSRRAKTGYFILEGLNSFVTVYYFYYFYFFMQKAYGFGNQANLGLAALNGATYMVAAWCGGRFAQKFGYLKALKLGFAGMWLGLAAGSQMTTARGHILAMVATILGMSLTWPTLEALVSEGESPAALPHILGIYNVLWAGTGALAYFAGGALLDKLGLQSLFYVPTGLLTLQLAFTFWLESRFRLTPPITRSEALLAESANSPRDSSLSETGTLTNRTPDANSVAELNPRPIARTRRFLRMAWLANPFAYIAINTMLAVMPEIANRLGLSTMLAGFCGSVWCFARLASFCALWFWKGWHYRFRWLLAAYVALVVGFAIILLVPSLAAVVLAQLLFGGAVGLIYYSSLFYSMDAGDTKGEHGGIHEAAIGLGNFAGPTVGAASLHFLPQYPNSGALAVSALLLFGLGGLLVIAAQERAL